MRLAMTIDLERCIGCHACVTACKERWDTGPGAQRCWVNEYEHGERGKDLGVSFYPGLCMQCAEHPCTQDCPTGATYRTETYTAVDQQRCIACRLCMMVCPFGAIHVARTDVGGREKPAAFKCDLCVQRPGGPACVEACPTGALSLRFPREVAERTGELVARQFLEALKGQRTLTSR